MHVHYLASRELYFTDEQKEREIQREKKCIGRIIYSSITFSPFLESPERVLYLFRAFAKIRRIVCL